MARWHPYQRSAPPPPPPPPRRCQRHPITGETGIASILGSLSQAGVLLHPTQLPGKPVDLQAQVRGPPDIAIGALRVASQATRATRLDQATHRRIMALRAKKTGSSRAWYGGEAAWIMASTPASGRAATAQAPVAHVQEVEEASSGGPEERVPEDPAHPACLLSGETFDKAWDCDLECWVYLGATVLRGAAAAAVGLADGAIVKTAALCDAM